jgi:integrase
MRYRVIRRVKGAKKLGVRVGNWLLANEARALWELPDAKTLKGKRDRAILSLLLACGLRRGEVAALELDDIQRREDHWAIVDLTGKVDMFGRCLFLIGSHRRLLTGSPRPA